MLSAIHTECHYAECHYAQCHYTECHYAECHYAECHYAECHFADCLGALDSITKNEGPDNFYTVSLMAALIKIFTVVI